MNQKTHVLSNILIFETGTPYPRMITADQAIWDQKTWRLRHGHIMDLDDLGRMSFATNFDSMDIQISRDLATFFSETKTPREMDSAELKMQIENFNKSGINTRDLAVEYYTKTSLPGACFIFGVVGIAFCLWFVQSGKDWWGVVVAVCLSVLSVGFYFFWVAVCRSLAKSMILPVFTPFWGAWAPNIIFGLLGLGFIVYQSVKR
jgi:lipopolysaccharide export LptBFGC system permease protein LptF